jgi:hypothetical protein
MSPQLAYRLPRENQASTSIGWRRISCRKVALTAVRDNLSVVMWRPYPCMGPPSRPVAYNLTARPRTSRDDTPPNTIELVFKVRKIGTSVESSSKWSDDFRPRFGCSAVCASISSLLYIRGMQGQRELKARAVRLVRGSPQMSSMSLDDGA